VEVEPAVPRRLTAVNPSAAAWGQAAPPSGAVAVAGDL